jgi:hypothetical protein
VSRQQPFDAVKPGAESFYRSISFLARSKLTEYYLLLAGRILGRRGCWLGFDGLCPAVKTRVIMMAPEVCAVVSAMAQALEPFLLA